jgi:putative protease
MSRKKPELLSPASDASCLQAALAAGCDAVYVGLKNFSMRSTAANFSLPALRRAAALCHGRGVKLYLALNSQLYQHELRRMRAQLAAVADVIDAVICWDPAVIDACRQLGLAIHISTQASVANAAAARFYRELGATRIVPARECTLPELQRMGRQAGIEIEVFAHGAMCVSISGRCYLSQDSYGKSGNRGECLQNCRRPFRVVCTDGEGDYEVEEHALFSAKDLCTLPFLDQILDAGVAALKIEGRNRPADYVACITDAYRRAIDAWAAGSLDQDLKQSLVEQCRRVYNRSFSDGFFLGRPISDFTQEDGNAASERKELVGKVINYYRKARVAHIWVQQHSIEEGERILVMGPSTGAVQQVARNIRYEDAPERTPSQTITLLMEQPVRANDEVYRLVPRDSKLSTTTPHT